MNSIDLLKFHLSIKKEQWITITDNSMKPTLFAKNQVKVISATTWNKGDIVVFERRDHLVIHRVVYINGEKIFFKGDNNSCLDDDSDIKKIVGKLNGKFVFSRLVASLSYDDAIKTKSKVRTVLLKCMCHIEHLQKKVTHNLRENISN